MDFLKFKLKNGESVEAIPVKETPYGTLYCFRDCIRLQFPMCMTGRIALPDQGCADARMIYEKYPFTDLNKFLNTYVLDLFPDDIRKKMLPAFHSVSSLTGDCLRIPYEKEIYGRNTCGIDDGDDIEQWECMNDDPELRNAKIAGELDWYWMSTPFNTALEPNLREGDPDVFVVGANRIPAYEVSCRAHGIRPVFMLMKEKPDNKQEIEPRWMRKCLCMKASEFERLVKIATGRDDLYFHYDMDGLWISGDDEKEEITDDKLCKLLSDLLNINVTSVHIDDCDMTGVWIVYE